MSAAGITDALVAAIGSGRYDFIVANYANPDMVGHTGVWDATIEALATVDASLGRVVGCDRRPSTRADPAGPGALLAITADHGNADDAARRGRAARHGALAQPGAVRARRPAPWRAAGSHDGVLADVAPTLLELADLPPWAGITGRSLLDR